MVGFEVVGASEVELMTEEAVRFDEFEPLKAVDRLMYVEGAHDAGIPPGKGGMPVGRILK